MTLLGSVVEQLAVPIVSSGSLKSLNEELDVFKLEKLILRIIFEFSESAVVAKSLWKYCSLSTLILEVKDSGCAIKLKKCFVYAEWYTCDDPEVTLNIAVP